MDGFKHKNTKKIVINSKQTTTLDGKHSDMLNEFNNNNSKLFPSLETEKDALKQKLCENKENPRLSIEELLDIKERIKNIRIQIRDTKWKEKNYLLSNSNIIFDYFEEKKKISEGTNELTRLDKFFNIKKNKTKPTENKNNVQKYLVNVDDSFLNIDSFINHTDVCTSCNKGELIPVDHEGILICNNCHVTLKYLVDNEKSSYTEPP